MKEQLEEMTDEEMLELPDEEDVILLLERAHLILTTVLDRKLPATLHSDAVHLRNDIESLFTMHRLH